jgi:hypothetical protein
VVYLSERVRGKGTLVIKCFIGLAPGLGHGTNTLAYFDPNVSHENNVLEQ